MKNLKSLLCIFWFKITFSRVRDCTCLPLRPLSLDVAAMHSRVTTLVDWQTRCTTNENEKENDKCSASEANGLCLPLYTSTVGSALCAHAYEYSAECKCSGQLLYCTVVQQHATHPAILKMVLLEGIRVSRGTLNTASAYNTHCSQKYLLKLVLTEKPSYAFPYRTLSNKFWGNFRVTGRNIQGTRRINESWIVY